ncbi:AMP-binding protein [Streptomyces chiangmaiensis]
MEATRGTVAELVRQGWGDHRTGLWFEGRALTRHEVAAGAAARAALFADLLPPCAEPHLGVLLDNTPEYPLWLSAAALAGAAVAGINPTRRGAELARDILHTECRVLVTERALLPLLDGLDLPGVRLLVTDTDACADLVAGYQGAEPEDSWATPADRLLLYFTSGSTGAPKAAICTQGRLAAAGRSLVRHFGLGADDVHYICMPMFHGNAVVADWAPALVSGAAIALRRRFSASGFLDDVRAYGATYFTYVRRAVSYVLATEERPDDRDNPCGWASAILARYEGAVAVAVYAVPDPVAGDQVMAAMALGSEGFFDPDGFAAFLAAQPDLGTKMAPRFVRVVAGLPVTATNKIHRVGLRGEGFRCADPVWWMPPGQSAYRRLTEEDVAGLVADFPARGREELLFRRPS